MIAQSTHAPVNQTIGEHNRMGIACQTPLQDAVEIVTVSSLLTVIGNVIALLGMQNIVESQRQLHPLLRAVASYLLHISPAEAKWVGLLGTARFAVLGGKTSCTIH